MIYSDYDDEKLSMLGFGSMRLPTVKNDGDIDIAKTKDLIDTAIKSGINYFDTAWGYHMGNSETVVGTILKNYPRDSYYLSSKFPGYDIGNFGKHEEIFEKQLQKCQTDHFDFYFIHNVCELNIEYYLNEEKYHTIEYFLEQKKKGRIRHLGFSTHGSVKVIGRFLDKFGEHMEFGMIQLNYLDYSFQYAKEKVDLLNSRNIPIWAMEPLRGGMLSKMPSAQFGSLEALRPGSTPAEWAFRFLQSIPGVKVILTGMSDMGQMMEKIRFFEKSEPLDQTEFIALLEAARNMISDRIVPCTGCKYCVSYCPKYLDIPSILEAYNEHTVTGGGFIAPFFVQALPKDRRPSACIGCKRCEKVCPQEIKISGVMTSFGKDMDTALSTMF